MYVNILLANICIFIIIIIIIFIIITIIDLIYKQRQEMIIGSTTCQSSNIPNNSATYSNRRLQFRPLNSFHWQTLIRSG
jgi:hypothetical protein